VANFGGRMNILKIVWELISLKRRIIWIAALVVLLVLTAGNYFWADANYKQVTASREKEKQEKLQKEEFLRQEKLQKDDLLNFVKEITSKNLKVVNKTIPKLKSKFFVFNNDNDESTIWIAKINNQFPENVIAKNKNELKTIVKVEQQKKAVRRYTDGSQGYKFIFVISVIDVAQEAIISTKEIWGSEPPSTKRGRIGAAYGSYPSEEVINYVKNLPVDP